MENEQQVQKRLDRFADLIKKNKLKTKNDKQKLLTMSAVMRELESILDGDGSGAVSEQ